MVQGINFPHSALRVEAIMPKMVTLTRTNNDEYTSQKIARALLEDSAMIMNLR